MDLMEKVFGTVYISGGEGWSAQQGEDVLDTKHSDHDDEIDGEDDAESRRDIPTKEAVGAESRRGVPTQETDVASESRNFGSKNVGLLLLGQRLVGKDQGLYKQDKLWLM